MRTRGRARVEAAAPLDALLATILKRREADRAQAVERPVCSPAPFPAAGGPQSMWKAKSTWKATLPGERRAQPQVGGVADGAAGKGRGRGIPHMAAAPPGGWGPSQSGACGKRRLWWAAGPQGCPGQRVRRAQQRSVEAQRARGVGGVGGWGPGDRWRGGEGPGARGQGGPGARA